MILFLQHINIEGPETIGSFFQKHGYQTKVCSLYKGDQLPDSLEGIEAVINLGGPMNVYEEKKYPFLKDVDVFIQRVLEVEIPYIGICLGSQLLAKAAGGKVVRSPEEEIGFDDIDILADDPLFAGLEKKLNVFHWHGDMSEIPEGAVSLASSSGCPMQAFRVGQNAYGLQFHVEITDKSIREWSDRYYKDEKIREEKKIKMLADYDKVKNTFNAVAERMYNNFLNIIIKFGDRSSEIGPSEPDSQLRTPNSL